VYLSYLACNAQAPYYSAICGLSCRTTFFHIISYTARIKKKLNIKYLQLLSETFLISRRIEGEIIINIHINDLLMTINVFLLLYYLVMTQVSWKLMINTKIQREQILLNRILMKQFQAKQLVLNIEKKIYCEIYTYKFIACSTGYQIGVFKSIITVTVKNI
jgi:hypothetical protein